MLEFHIHGSNATKKKLLEVLNTFPKFREAEPVSPHKLLNLSRENSPDEHSKTVSSTFFKRRALMIF